MTDDAFNMSMRKFLKEVGVTSQQQIERAVREGNPAPGPLKVRAVVTIEALGVEHVVEGKIEVPQ